MKKKLVVRWLYLRHYLIMTKILVTGANGLLGQHLVKLLLENDFIVIGTGKAPAGFRLSRVTGSGISLQT